MNRLKLQASVDEIQPRRTSNVHGGPELALRESLPRTQIGGAGSPMRKGDLDVEWHGDKMAGKEEDGAARPGGHVAPEQDVEVEVEVAGYANDLDGSCPGGTATRDGPPREQVGPGEEVEVEAGDGHDGIVRVALVLHCPVGGGIPDEAEAIVIRRSNTSEEGWRGDEEWYVLDVRVVYGIVGHEVMHIVTALPPSYGETRAEIANEDSNERVNHEVVPAMCESAALCRVVPRADILKGLSYVIPRCPAS